jgi:trk system potassium uptake protein TrkA
MKFAVIGMGSFGASIARSLYESGEEVLAIDRDKARVEAVRANVSHAVIMDAADKENLDSLGLPEMDVVVVSMGPDLESSILTVLYLRELAVPRIVAKALSEDHVKILQAVGAHEVVYPEKDMAVRTAHRLASPNVLEYLPLLSGMGIQESAPPESFIGHALRDLDLRQKFGVQVLAVKELVPEKTTFVPTADFVIKDSDVLILMGDEKDLARFNELS